MPWSQTSAPYWNEPKGRRGEGKGRKGREGRRERERRKERKGGREEGRNKVKYTIQCCHSNIPCRPTRPREAHRQFQSVCPAQWE